MLLKFGVHIQRQTRQSEESGNQKNNTTILKVTSLKISIGICLCLWPQSISVHITWNMNQPIFSSLEVVKMTTFSAAGGGGLVGVAAFPLQCQWICTMIMFYPAPTDGRYSNGLRCLRLLYFSKFGIGVVKADNEPAMAHFICANVYWRDNVHADVPCWLFMCQ